MEFELDIMLSICDADDSGQVFRFHAWKMLGSLPVAFLVSKCCCFTFLMSDGQTCSLIMSLLLLYEYLDCVFV